MKLTTEAARAEFEKWLDFRHVKQSKREAFEQQEEVIVEAIADGDLIVEEDMKLRYTLLTPLTTDDGEEFLKTLVFKPRIRKQELIKHYKGLKPDDADGRLLATIAALTADTPSEIAVTRDLIGKIYTEDMSVCEAIAVYFL